MTLKPLSLIPLFALLIGAHAGCSKKSSDDVAPVVPPSSSDGTARDYANQQNWLCLPGREDVCSAPLNANELLADGTFGLFDPNPTPDESVDCFYVHPTSDLSVKAGNSENFEYLAPVEELATMQASPFRSVCRLFAPLYRQVTIGTYVLPKDEQKPYLDVAASDVQQAFDHYMTHHNAGRKIVFIGHSQGSEMISILLKARFDDVPAMRSQLLLAIVPGFGLQAPIGTPVGGTFTNIPACTTAGEVGCVVSFRTYKNGTAYLGDGNISLLEMEEEICVNPGTLDISSLSAEDRRTAEVPLTASLLPPSDWISEGSYHLQSGLQLRPRSEESLSRNRRESPRK